MSFHSSTQRRFWLFQSPEALAELREKANQNAVDRIRQIINAANGSQANADDGDAAGADDASSQGGGPAFLSAEDEAILLSFFLERMTEMAKSLKKPDKVKATSIMYYKRFFLYNSVMDFSPKEIMLTCLFLACKAEDAIATMDQFLKPIKKGSEEIRSYILQYEIVVVEQLRFHLQVHNPFHAIEGLCTGAKTRGGCFTDRVESTYQAATERCVRGLSTDALLLYPPSHIALACVMAEAGPDTGAFTTFAHGTLGIPNEVMDEIPTILNILNPLEEQKDRVKAVDKKLRHLKKYFLDPNSSEYRQRLVARISAEKHKAAVVAAGENAVS